MDQQKCAYDYADKCDCSEDDKCGCTFPNNLPHNFDCDFSGDPAFNHSLTQNTNQEKDLFSKSSENITFRPDLNMPLPDSSPQKGEEHV